MSCPQRRTPLNPTENSRNERDELCAWRHGEISGLTAYAWAHELAPVWNQVPILLSQGLRLWDNALHARLPAWGFPKLDLGIPAPQFRHLSRNAEKDIIRMRVMEGLLNDPAYERRWWKPLRSNPGVRPLGLPDVLRINYRWNRPGRAPALNA